MRKRECDQSINKLNLKPVSPWPKNFSGSIVAFHYSLKAETNRTTIPHNSQFKSKQKNNRGILKIQLDDKGVNSSAAQWNCKKSTIAHYILNKWFKMHLEKKIIKQKHAVCSLWQTIFFFFLWQCVYLGKQIL